MGKLQPSQTFQELLEGCSDSASPLWESRWKEFIKRYNAFIHGKVAQECRQWGISRIQRQFSEFVNDIAVAVYSTLCKNECQTLRRFRAKDNERVFLAWLATICVRTASRHIHKLLKEILIDEENEEGLTALRSLDSNQRWELYEMVVAKLRGAAKRETDNRERDIHIFQLSIFADFSQEVVRVHPCLKTVGHRVVELVLYRMRKVLREHKNNFA
jgi:hypothetical protein